MSCLGAGAQTDKLDWMEDSEPTETVRGLGQYWTMADYFEVAERSPFCIRSAAILSSCWGEGWGVSGE